MKILKFLIIFFLTMSHSFAKDGLFRQELTHQQQDCLQNERKKCFVNFFNEKQIFCLEGCHVKSKGIHNKKIRCNKKCNLPQLDEEEKLEFKKCKKSTFQKCSIKKKNNNFSLEKKKCLRQKHKECYKKISYVDQDQELCITKCVKKYEDLSKKKMKKICKKHCKIPKMTKDQKIQDIQCRKKSHKLCRIINK